MFYDLMKILNKCLKFWYIFIATLVIGFGAVFIFVKPVKTYSAYASIKSEFLNREVLWNEHYNFDAHDELRTTVLEFVVSNYQNDNLSEIRKNLNIEDDEIYFIMSLAIGGSGKISLWVQAGSQEICEQGIKYILNDLAEYLENVIDDLVDPKYRVQTDNTFVSGLPATMDVSNGNVFKASMIVIAILIAEVCVIGFITLRKKTIDIDEELEVDFGAKTIIKDYVLNIKELETFLNRNQNFKENTLIISENPEFINNKYNNKQLKVVDLSSISSIESFHDIEETSFVVEIVKGETKKKDVANLVNILQVLDLNNICFVTRRKE